MFFQLTFIPGFFRYRKARKKDIREKKEGRKKAKAANICRLTQHLWISVQRNKFTKWKHSAFLSVCCQNVLCLTFRWFFSLHFAYPFTISPHFTMKGRRWDDEHYEIKKEFHLNKFDCVVGENLNREISMDFLPRCQFRNPKSFYHSILLQTDEYFA